LSVNPVKKPFSLFGGKIGFCYVFLLQSGSFSEYKRLSYHCGKFNVNQVIVVRKIAGRQSFGYIMQKSLQKYSGKVALISKKFCTFAPQYLLILI
jgi:hypothetical protein